MAQPKWLEKYLRMKPEVSQILDDLEVYREFCVSHGRTFNEAALYNERDRDFADFLKFQERGYAKNYWNWANKDPNERKPWNGEKRPFTGERKGYQGNNFKPNYRPGQ
jgi:hypothetical protein